jgi:plastocyanin
MMRKVRLFGALFLLPWLLIAVFGSRYVAAAPEYAPPADPQAWTVMLGHQVFTEAGEKPTWEADRFYPENITINAGDSVTYKHDSGSEPHTASFLGPDNKFPDFAIAECNGAPCPPPPPGAQPGPPPPGVTVKVFLNPAIGFPAGGSSVDGSAYVNSGVMAQDIPGPTSSTLTFSKPGTYTIVCLVHAVQLPDGSIVGMQSKVVVQAAGSALPKTPDQVVAAAQADMAADEAEAKTDEATADAHTVADSPGPNGTTIHHVDVSYTVFKPTYALDYMRFTPGDVTINQGDTVEWSSPTAHTFHNVIFGEEPEVFTVVPQTGGPPKLYLNMDVFGPVGPNPGVQSGTGVASAGIIVGPEDPPQAGVQNYALTFTQPGRYEYACGLHYHIGMTGAVVVRASTGGTPGMPTTGSGTGETFGTILLATMLALTGVAGGLWLRRNYKTS